MNEACLIRETVVPKDKDNLDSTIKRVDISTIQALAAQAPAVVSLRRQLEERLVRYAPTRKIDTTLTP